MLSNIWEKSANRELLDDIRSWFLRSVMEILWLSKINPSQIVEALNKYRNPTK